MLRDRLQSDLAQAMKDRDMARVTVRRSILSAFGNAEAVAGTSSSEGAIGYADVPRRSLTDDDVERVIGGEF